MRSRQAAPRRVELVRKILLASAAVPGLFPPVMIDVLLDQAKHQEMHVDGGTVSQVFLYPPSSGWQAILRRTMPRGRPPTSFATAAHARAGARVERKTLAIAGRAIETMIASNGVGDLYRIYTTAQRDRIEFKLALIGDDFKQPYTAPFDHAYMAKLFDYGLGKGRAGYAWRTTPPDFDKPSTH